jgi:hypothetical protein
MIDRLRELLLPTLALTILASLWTVAKVRIAEEDLDRRLPPAPLAMWQKAVNAGAEADADDKAHTDAQAQVDVAHPDP